MPSRSRTQGPHVLPLSDPARTVALCLSRWSDSPDDPLGIQIDHTLLDRLGWRPATGSPSSRSTWTAAPARAGWSSAGPPPMSPRSS